MLRKNAHLRQMDVARMLGHTSADRISHWEKGRSVPSLVNLFKLSIIYRTSPEDLYGELYDSIAQNLTKDPGVRIPNATLGSMPSQILPIPDVDAAEDNPEKAL